MLQKILKVVAWLVGIVWMTFFVIAIAYREDPVVRGAVRSMAVAVASVFTDVKDLKNEVKSDIKKELKKELTVNNRKLKAFYVTIVCVMIVFLAAILKGIPFTGDNVVALGFTLAGVSTAFFGANGVEHWAKAKGSSDPPAGQ